MSILDLARSELRDLEPYRPGAYEPDTVRLNANESPYRLPSDTTERGLNVYPPPRPETLRRALAAHYGADLANLLVTRGSSEAIDILIRGFCRAGLDAVITCPPTFDMYRVYATIQGAAIRKVPLLVEQDFAFDIDGVVGSIDDYTKIVFLCTPNNPTGRAVPKRTIVNLAERTSGKVLLVIDEAYYEFSTEADCRDLIDRFEHVVVLRTLSKFVSLAGARCGAVLANTAVIRFLEAILPPYTFPTPSIELVAAALDESSIEIARERVGLIRRERRRLTAALSNLPEVVHVFHSDANFVLTRVRDRQRFMDLARRAGILLRAFDNDPALADCVRITVGRPEDNDRLLQAVSNAGVAAHG